MQGQKHHSGLDANDTDLRLEAGHATHPSFVRRIPEKHVFGTVEEIAHRGGGTIPTLPDRVPSRFTQLGPQSVGGNANERKPRNYAGNQKFGRARRYA